MKIISTVEELKNYRKGLKAKTIGFVPSLGGLHQGHLSLVKTSKSNNDCTIVSLFLNPTQFDKKADFENYPAEFAEDLELLRIQGVDCVFAPTSEELYPDNFRYKVLESEQSQKLCGESRPGHFTGVLTVVVKLLNLVDPDRAYFGEKDRQQLELIQGMVDALFMRCEIVPCPIVRDEQGLALSSRNRRLSKQGLKKAHYFAKRLQSISSLEKLEQDLLKEGIQVDYLEDQGEHRFAAVLIDEVRLIDNVQI